AEDSVVADAPLDVPRAIALLEHFLHIHRKKRPLVQASADVIGQIPIFERANQNHLSWFGAGEVLAPFQHGAAPGHPQVEDLFAIRRGRALNADAQTRVLPALERLLYRGFQERSGHSRMSQFSSISASGCPLMARSTSTTASRSLLAPTILWPVPTTRFTFGPVFGS